MIGKRSNPKAKQMRATIATDRVIDLTPVAHPTATGIAG